MPSCHCSPQLDSAVSTSWTDVCPSTPYHAWSYLVFPNCIISSAVLPFPKNCYRASLPFYMLQCHNDYFTARSCKSVSKQVSTADWHQSRSTPMMCQYSLQRFCSKYVLLYKSRPKLQHIIHSWLCSVVQLRYVPYVSYFFHSLTLVTYLAHS